MLVTLFYLMNDYIIIFISLCGSSNRPHYGSCPSVCPSVRPSVTHGL